MKNFYKSKKKLSVALCIKNEEEKLKKCLDAVTFADEIIILLDGCTDNSKEIAKRYTKKIIEGRWPIEGDRRNLAIKHCKNEWILEVDADEIVSKSLAIEVKKIIQKSKNDWHPIKVNNHIGEKLINFGWGCYIGKGQCAGLFRNGFKIWGSQRVHPKIELKGDAGLVLKKPLDHFVDNDIKDMFNRLNAYTDARALDIRDNNNGGNFLSNVKRIFSRFFKCYILRKGYKEGRYGFFIALCAGLYPICSYLKAKK